MPGEEREKYLSGVLTKSRFCGIILVRDRLKLVARSFVHEYALRRHKRICSAVYVRTRELPLVALLEPRGFFFPLERAPFPMKREGRGDGFNTLPVTKSRRARDVSQASRSARARQRAGRAAGEQATRSKRAVGDAPQERASERSERAFL